MKKVKGFSFDTEEDKEILKHIEKQQNQSVYIKELVRKDMYENSIEEIVKRQIEKYLANIGIQNIEEPIKIDASEVMNILEM